MKKKIKGALALEAVISLSIFMCFMFMLMAVVRLSMVYITINDVTAETAKRIAGMSYVVQYVNDIYDNKVNKAEEYLTEKLSLEGVVSSNSSASSIVQYMGLSGLGDSLSESSIANFLSNIAENFLDSVLTNVESFLMNKQQELVSNIFIGLVEESNVSINTDNITVVLFTFPLSSTTFDHQKSNIAETTGIDEDDLDRNDVILVVEYKYTIAVPFFPSYDVTLRSTSVERGWLNGGDHATPSKREGVKLDNLMGTIVYYTNSGNGKKYHKQDCITLSRSGQNKQPVSIEKAKNMGLEPCKVCTPNVGS